MYPEGTVAREHVRIPFQYLRNGWTDCTEIWCVGRGPVTMRFTQNGRFCTNASVTFSHLSTSIRSRSFIAPKGMLLVLLHAVHMRVYFICILMNTWLFLQYPDISMTFNPNDNIHKCIPITNSKSDKRVKRHSVAKSYRTPNRIFINIRSSGA